MIGTLAQQIAIVSYGNHALVTGETNECFLENSVFQFCADVNFIKTQRNRQTGQAKGYMLANHPNEWFGLLRKEGCKKLKLFYLPPKKSAMPAHMTAGFIGGGGTWLIEARYNGRSDYWTSRWKIKDKDAPDKKIWTVYYAKINFNHPSEQYNSDLEDIKLRFSNLLNEIYDFALNQKENRWADVFDKARKTLISNKPNEAYFHKDLMVKESYQLPARQLVFAAGMAWVFGGMGWWNDLTIFDKDAQSKHLKLTKDLYEIIIQAIQASINSY